ncbi:MAG: hypothetical protein IKR76_12080, partial [Ruminococcus sp.]|nr:hypothetical protein [Ruminococcus sp.]
NIKYALIGFVLYNLVLGGITGGLCLAHEGRLFTSAFRTCISIYNGIGASFIFFWLLLRSFARREEIKIYRQKGICDDYIAAINKGNNKLTNLELLNLANAYMHLERFDEAERVLGGMPGESLLHGPSKPYYYKSYIWLYLNTGRLRQALDIFDASRDLLERFFSGEGANGSSFYDDAALCMAIRRDFAAADRYRNLSAQAVEGHPERAYSPYMIMAELFALDGNEQEAVRAADAARQAVFSCRSFKYPWQRDSALRTVDMGLSLARWLRKQLYG